MTAVEVLRERRMTAARIVPAFDEVKHCEPGVDLRAETLPIQPLTLEGREEALAQGVVVGIPDAAHRRPDARLPTPTTEGERGVLAAVVRVMNHCGRPALGERHVEGGQDELGVDRRRAVRPARLPMDSRNERLLCNFGKTSATPRVGPLQTRPLYRK
jgi:hypothetical protein